MDESQQDQDECMGLCHMVNSMVGASPLLGSAQKIRKARMRLGAMWRWACIRCHMVVQLAHSDGDDVDSDYIGRIIRCCHVETRSKQVDTKCLVGKNRNCQKVIFKIFF